MFRDNGQGIFSQCLCLSRERFICYWAELPPSHQGCVDLRSLFGSSLTASRDGAPPIDSSAAGDLCFLFLLRIKIVFATASSLVGLFDLLVFGVGNRIRDRRDPWGVSLASKQALSFEPVIHIVPGRAALLLPKSVGEVLNRMDSSRAFRWRFLAASEDLLDSKCHGFVASHSASVVQDVRRSRHVPLSLGTERRRGYGMTTVGTCYRIPPLNGSRRCRPIRGHRSKAFGGPGLTVLRALQRQP